jgi:glycogen synthase
MAAQFYPPIVGGEERHVQNLARHLVARHHEVTVLTLAAGPEDVGTSDDRGVRVVRILSTMQRVPMVHHDLERPHASPLPDGSVARAAGTLIRTMGPDVVHAHNWIVNSLLGRCRASRTPVVLTLHDYSHVCAVKRMMRRGAECAGPSLGKCATCSASHYGVTAGVPIALANFKGAGARAAGVSRFIAVSTPVAERNRLSAGSVPHQVIPNFIPDEILDPLPQVSAWGRDSGPIAFVGDLSDDKGVPVLLAAYRKLKRPPPLVLAGRRAGRSLDLPGGARVLSELPHADVMTLMRSSRFVVVPSVWPDPCPTVVLEAMAVGRPVIAAASGGIVDMVQHGVTGRLVAPGDATALGAAMVEVLDLADQGRAMGISGRVAVEAFTASHVVPRIESVYAEVAGHRRGG